MALIPKFHVVAAKATVDPNSLSISMGMCVALNGSAGVRRVTTGDTGKVYGIAGDNYSTSAASMPGISEGWQNRVSDGYDETKASGEITVYHSGGEFATDQFVNTNVDATKIGHYLKVSDSTGTLAYDGATKSANSIAVLTKAAGTYPSGVPGTDLNGDMALAGSNSNQYIEFKLIV